MEEQKDKLERIYQKLNEEEDTVLKKWHESIITKLILLFPTIAFACLLYTSPSPRDRH